VTAEIDPPLARELAAVAEAHGVLRLAPVRLEHPGLVYARAAFDEFVAGGLAGEMQYLVRAASVRRDPSEMLPGAQTYLAGLVPYEGEPGPVARYARSSDYHTEIHHRLEFVVARLHDALPEAASVICVDTKPVLERSLAALAGLGFLGKNGLLIAPGLGSYVLLGGILTTAAWRGPDAVQDPATATWQACGACTRCLDACPTDAFVAAGQLDPRRCISYSTIEHRGPIDDAVADATGERIAGCDVCQEVCPYNAGRTRHDRVPEAAWLPPAPPRAAEAGDLLGLVNVRSNPYRAFVRGTALRRIPRRHMRRNVLVAIGNREGAPSVAEDEQIEVAIADEDPSVRDAATRARRRRGRPP
jgi:epoxyqueuosine reductase